MTGRGDGSAEQPIILWDAFGGEQGALIILDDAGKWYTNQTGGCACSHPEAQGHLLSVTVPCELQNLLYNYYGGIFHDTAVQINDILVRAHLPVQVDFDKIGESEEAWLFVTIMGEAAILTWENSD
ncbi:MAG: DUF6210 family protein [Thermomicrobia bacterium]|nr:DUF6210 family protein [Thermomicrobia bacterium]